MLLVAFGLTVLLGSYCGELSDLHGDEGRGWLGASSATLTRSHDKRSRAGGVVGEKKTYHVATTGSDANPGTQTQPFRTIAHGASVLTPGATLYVTSGTYAESLYNTIPGGTSWSQPVTVAAYPGHVVTIRPNPGADRVLHFQGTATAYIVVEGFILDAVNVTYDAVKITAASTSGPAHHIRLIRCEVKNAPNQGILVTGGAHSNEFISLAIHDNGTDDFDHGVYIKTENNLVEGSRIYQNAGWGVHVYALEGPTAHHNVIRNNQIFDNARVGARGPGILLSSGTGNMAYNNLIWGNRGGVDIAYGASHTKVYHNVVYGNGSYGIRLRPRAMRTVVQNNIVYQNVGLPIFDNGVGTVQDHNLLNRDPHFVNATGHDFRLQPSSPAINAGVTVSWVTTDYEGTPRPQGVAHDIGAFELLSAKASTP